MLFLVFLSRASVKSWQRVGVYSVKPNLHARRKRKHEKKKIIPFSCVCAFAWVVAWRVLTSITQADRPANNPPQRGCRMGR